MPPRSNVRAYPAAPPPHPHDSRSTSGTAAVTTAGSNGSGSGTVSSAHTHHHLRRPPRCAAALLTTEGRCTLYDAFFCAAHCSVCLHLFSFVCLLPGSSMSQPIRTTPLLCLHFVRPAARCSRLPSACVFIALYHCLAAACPACSHGQPYVMLCHPGPSHLCARTLSSILHIPAGLPCERTRP